MQLEDIGCAQWIHLWNFVIFQSHKHMVVYEGSWILRIKLILLTVTDTFNDFLAGRRRWQFHDKTLSLLLFQRQLFSVGDATRSRYDLSEMALFAATGFLIRHLLSPHSSESRSTNNFSNDDKQWCNINLYINFFGEPRPKKTTSHTQLFTSSESTNC